MNNKYLEYIKIFALPNKYTKWYINIIEKSLLRPQNKKILKETLGYIERHHIVPKCFNLGGERDEKNLVYLTGREHFVLHSLIIKMFTGLFNNKMQFAFRMMKVKNKNEKRYFNSKLYSLLRRKMKHTEYTKTKMSINCSNPNLGKSLSEETKRKISNAQKGKYNGEKNPMYGKHINMKKIKQINSSTGEIIKIWDSLKEASYVLNLHTSNICSSLRGINKTSGGFKWEYIKYD